MTTTELQNYCSYSRCQLLVYLQKYCSYSTCHLLQMQNKLREQVLFTFKKDNMKYLQTFGPFIFMALELFQLLVTVIICMLPIVFGFVFGFHIFMHTSENYSSPLQTFLRYVQGVLNYPEIDYFNPCNTCIKNPASQQLIYIMISSHSHVYFQLLDGHQTPYFPSFFSYLFFL